MKIYTKKGDSGETSLFGGKKVAKNHPLICAYGTIDELNSLIGFLSSFLKEKQIADFLLKIQNDLMIISSFLSGSKIEIDKIVDRITEMEKNIDVYWGKLPILKNFIIPSGSQLSTLIHLVRSVTRRAEREVVTLSKSESDTLLIIKYLNRLSDYFFVLARRQNFKDKKEEIIWKKTF
jgi:cob(I)alamin adenosyltransferase